MLVIPYYGPLLDSLYTGSDALEACKIINDELARQDSRYCVDWNVSHHYADYLFHTRKAIAGETVT